MPARSRSRRGGAALLAVVVIACRPAAPIDVTDPRVAVGAERSCHDLGLSSVRCTLVTLRAAQLLEEERPDHAPIESQALHEAVAPPAGQEGVPASTVVPAVVVFTLEDGSRVGVPLLCPATPGDDEACNPQVR